MAKSTDSRPFSIVPMASHHLEAWLPLWEGYQAFYETQVSDEVTKATFERMLDGNIDMFGYIAIGDDEAALGFVTFIFHPTTFTTGDRCYLEDLFTSEAARRNGVARALIETVLKAAKARGADQVYWHTAENNYAGRSLYDRLGTNTHIKYVRKLDGDAPPLY